MKPVNNSQRSKLTYTVKELVEKLQQYPEDMPVIATWEGVHAGFREENFIVEENKLVIDVEDYG